MSSHELLNLLNKLGEKRLNARFDMLFVTVK